MRTADFAAQYAAPVVLWLEDELTRIYLDAVWQDPAFKFLIAGNVDAVSGLVGAAQTDGLRHVLGVADRDFRAGNVARWASVNGPTILIPAVHEVENHVLDFAGLAGCRLNTAGHTAAAIEAELLAFAGTLAWWMACRSVIHDLWGRFIGGFPGHPGCSNVTTQAEAKQCIVGSAWYSGLQARVAQTTPDAQVDLMLTAAHNRMTAFLATGAWRAEFSGKEMFRHIHRFIYPYLAPRRAGGMPQPTGTVREGDVIRAVAEWQAASGNVPSEIANLRASLKARLGIP